VAALSISAAAASAQTKPGVDKTGGGQRHSPHS
jgi:hypothetical protein